MTSAAGALRRVVQRVAGADARRIIAGQPIPDTHPDLLSEVCAWGVLCVRVCLCALVRQVGIPKGWGCHSSVKNTALLTCVLSEW
jgi:hypothetical protein